MKTDGTTVVVSSHLPVNIEPDNPTPQYLRPISGELARTLDAIMWNSGGTWIGCANAEGISALIQAGQEWRTSHGYSLVPVCICPEERADFERFSTETIWPLFHGFASSRTDPDCWSGYCRVNGKIAEAVRIVTKPEDFVWVHDYDLMMVAGLLRANGCHRRIGYFQHIPFPHPILFAKLPWHVEILHALLQFDLIGFQTDDDRRNFIGSLAAVPTIPNLREIESKAVVRVHDRDVKIGNYPVSIDFEEFSWDVSNRGVVAASEAIRKCSGGAQIVLSVDRSICTSGIKERLTAFRLLLERDPEMQGRITFVQIVNPYNDAPLESKTSHLQIESMVDQIHQRFARPDWTPVHYYNKQLTQAQLVVFYHSADVALITPIRDGMNLFAKEYCACKSDENGVLILSECSGAAETLKIGALLVNPFDVARVASAIHYALRMNESEKKKRMAALRSYIRSHNVFDWSHSFHTDAALTLRDSAREAV